MSEDKVTQQQHEEEEDIDLGYEEEEAPEPLPYSEPNTEEQKKINDLSQKVADLTKENKRLKRDYEIACHASDSYSNSWAEEWEKHRKLKKEYKQYANTVQGWLEAVIKGKENLDKLLEQSKEIQKRYQFE